MFTRPQPPALANKPRQVPLQERMPLAPHRLPQKGPRNMCFHSHSLIRARALLSCSVPLALAIGAGGVAGYMLASRGREEPRIIKTTTFDRRPAEIHWRGDGQVFDIDVPSKAAVSTHALLKAHEIESFLKANERSVPLDHRPMNPIMRWDTNFLPANPVCEDRISADLLDQSDTAELVNPSGPFWPAWRDIRTKLLSVVPRWSSDFPSASPGLGDEDVAFLSVFDGHEGTSVVEIVSKALHATLARALGQGRLFTQGATALSDIIERA